MACVQKETLTNKYTQQPGLTVTRVSRALSGERSGSALSPCRCHTVEYPPQLGDAISTWRSALVLTSKS